MLISGKAPLRRTEIETRGDQDRADCHSTERAPFDSKRRSCSGASQGMPRASGRELTLPDVEPQRLWGRFKGKSAGTPRYAERCPPGHQPAVPPRRPGWIRSALDCPVSGFSQSPSCFGRKTSITAFCPDCSHVRGSKASSLAVAPVRFFSICSAGAGATGALACSGSVESGISSR